jgi:ABC-type Fe3+ transport system substrate-binding protein
VFWNASCIALVPGAPHEAELRTVLEALLGPGQQRADVLTWKV